MSKVIKSNATLKYKKTQKNIKSLNTLRPSTFDFKTYINEKHIKQINQSRSAFERRGKKRID